MSAETAFAAALVDAGADAAFWHHEHGRVPVGMPGVPRWAVEAYAAARIARTPPDGIVAVLVGDANAAPEAAQPERVGARIGRALTARLGQLERRVRKVAAPATSSITEGREPYV